MLRPSALTPAEWSTAASPDRSARCARRRARISLLSARSAWRPWSTPCTTRRARKFHATACSALLRENAPRLAPHADRQAARRARDRAVGRVTNVDGGRSRPLVRSGIPPPTAATHADAPERNDYRVRSGPLPTATISQNRTRARLLHPLDVYLRDDPRPGPSRHGVAHIHC